MLYGELTRLVGFYDMAGATLLQAHSLPPLFTRSVAGYETVTCSVLGLDADVVEGGYRPRSEDQNRFSKLPVSALVTFVS